MVLQNTLRAPVTLTGISLHRGETTRLRILPAAAGTGIRFRRVDVENGVDIPATVDCVVDTSLATVLGRSGVEVSTVEHCLAALSGLGVDNAVVEVDGAELPILDGSAAPYVQEILRAGLRPQSKPRKMMRVDKPVRVRHGDKYSILRPAKSFKVTYTIDFEEKLSGIQHYCLEVTPEAFTAEIAMARTFGFLEDFEYLQAAGKAKGGNMGNAVVLAEGEVLNPEGLRMPGELVRHKILDAIGDLALSGMPIQGHLFVHKGGHALHQSLLKVLMARPDAWSLVTAGESRFDLGVVGFEEAMQAAAPA